MSIKSLQPTASSVRGSLATFGGQERADDDLESSRMLRSADA
jgi:hypothetical protein